ncbi:UNVERIFIED_CONTAM: hypothetical protein GTU68_005962, partial [Idotea baltica]|nr:hypothetical protein [Idotea baltica]
MGRSGSGKSTLLHCLAGLLVPDTGEIWFGEQRLDNLGDTGRSGRRLNEMGIVFQFGHLVPELTLLENVALPLMATGTKRSAAESRATELLDRLEITVLADRRPSEVSGGEMQR